MVVAPLTLLAPLTAKQLPLLLEIPAQRSLRTADSLQHGIVHLILVMAKQWQKMTKTTKKMLRVWCGILEPR